MAQPKRKQATGTETLRAEAQAALRTIDTEIAELDAKRLDLDPQSAVTKEIALAAARRDAQRRIELLDQRAADELRQRQAKAQEALIGRVEARFAQRDQHIAKMCDALTIAVTEMDSAIAANDAIMAAWPFDLVIESEPCLFGKFFRVAIRNGLYRLSGKPFVTTGAPGGWDFPGAECATPLGDVRPSAQRPLVERAREGSAFAARRMREAPVRVLPPAPPPSPSKPIEVKPAEVAPAATVEAPEQQPRQAPQAEYVYHARFTNRQTGEQRTEEVKLGPAELEEAALDGLGGTGPRAQEIALRLASERVGAEFQFDSLRFDTNRLFESLNRD
jgi:hypothetical protein